MHLGRVLKWARCAGFNGVDAVVKGEQRGRRHGSDPTLTLVQGEQLRLEIIGSNPAQLKPEFALWNRRAVMLAVKELFGIDMSIRTVGEYVRRWGFTPQRLRSRTRTCSMPGTSRSIRRLQRVRKPRMPRSTGATSRRSVRTRTGCEAARWQG